MLTGKWNGIRKIDSTGGEMKWWGRRWEARGKRREKKRRDWGDKTLTIKLERMKET